MGGVLRNGEKLVFKAGILIDPIEFWTEALKVARRYVVDIRQLYNLPYAIQRLCGIAILESKSDTVELR